MATCVYVDSWGLLQVMNPQPTDLSTCAMLLASPSDLSSVWAPLSASDGLSIGLAIWIAWMVAFGFRVLRRQADDLSSTSAQE